ncbi:2-polyprenylphenol 6-hydroxylase [Pyruvatibacter sp.]|uniref:2-polyprenylphenol 6-hydroxylase n=1 Tax=Pyruvatibacter sp. TaxID=1981328 RepID=UPI0032EB9CCB
MFSHVRNLGRLIRAAWVLSRYDALFAIDAGEPPAPVKAARAIARVRQKIGGANKLADGAQASEGDRLAAALTELGPSYIKLGQFLATRPDVVDPALARDLAKLQDRLPPFDTDTAQAIIVEEFGEPWSALYGEMSDAIAAASIAQVHKATTVEADGTTRDVAVKVLRPGIEQRFAADLETFFWVARLIDRAVPSSRRLKPIDVVQTLADSMALEMDLRLEAAAMSEMAERTKGDAGFRTPAIDWERTSKRVMTLEWIPGIPIADRARISAANLDPKAVAANLITTFLTHAVREGYFHADMHPGNLFVEADGSPGGTLVAVDYGIMGRLNAKESRFLAEILFGFVIRDYRRVAEVHFEAGYVPENKSVDGFAQALRAIGEPILGREAHEISMARLLAQLFEVTGQFEMETRPELIMLQKTMVVVEGVARDLDPDFNMWKTAEPVLRQWLESRIGPEGRLQDAVKGAERMGRLMGDLPDLLETAERAARSLAGPRGFGGGGGVADGLKLHPDTAKAIANAQAERERPNRIALWVGAVALAVIAVAVVI